MPWVLSAGVLLLLLLGAWIAAASAAARALSHDVYEQQGRESCPCCGKTLT